MHCGCLWQCYVRKPHVGNFYVCLREVCYTVCKYECFLPFMCLFSSAGTCRYFLLALFCFIGGLLPLPGSKSPETWWINAAFYQCLVQSYKAVEIEIFFFFKNIIILPTCRDFISAAKNLQPPKFNYNWIAKPESSAVTRHHWDFYWCIYFNLPCLTLGNTWGVFAAVYWGVGGPKAE